MKSGEKPAAQDSVESRLELLENALSYAEMRVWRLSRELAVLRASKNNPQRERLEKRVLDLENKFFAFQCGAQAQMERDRDALAFERVEPLEEEGT